MPMMQFPIFVTAVGCGRPVGGTGPGAEVWRNSKR